MMQQPLTLDGYCSGPLFAPVPVVRPKLQNRGEGRRRRVAKRVPAWADRAQIKWVYQWSKLLTKMTGEQHSVDHIVPLHHPLVCGLHTPDNLTIERMVVNRLKSNIYWPGMPMVQQELFT